MFKFSNPDSNQRKPKIEWWDGGERQRDFSVAHFRYLIMHEINRTHCTQVFICVSVSGACPQHIHKILFKMFPIWKEKRFGNGVYKIYFLSHLWRFIFNCSQNAMKIIQKFIRRDEKKVENPQTKDSLVLSI